MAVLYVFAASDIECRPVLAHMEGGAAGKRRESAISGQSGSNSIHLFKTGIGHDAARTTLRRCLEAGEKDGSGNSLPPADAIIVTGFAGSLSNRVGEGQIVTYSSCISAYDDASGAVSSADLSSRLLNALTRICAAKTVTGISTSRMAVTREEKDALAAHGAEAVDMESYEIISAANHAGIPVAVVRVISDSRDRELPDFNRALNGQGGFSSVKLASVCISHPIATWRLFKASRKAGLALGLALSAILKVDIAPLVGAESKVRLGVDLR
jgi:nucleoside phosphorylase